VNGIAPDPNFFMRYKGNILGAQGLSVNVVGGTLHYAGRVEAAGFALQPDATLLTGLVNGGATRIDAGEINLASGSSVGFAPFSIDPAAPLPFDYGRRLDIGANPVVQFNADALSNNAAIKTSSGAFAVGPYDYAYGGVAWNGDKSAAQADVVSRTFNHRRGGTDAAAAPLALAARDPGTASVHQRLLRRFAEHYGPGRKSDRQAAALMGLYLNEGAAAPGFAGLARPRVARPAEEADGRREDRDRPRRFSLAGGGESLSGDTGLWVAPGYGHADHHGDRRYDIEGPNIAMGIDHRFGENVFLGVGIGLDQPRYSGGDARVDARSFSAFLYAGFNLPLSLELGLVASYGRTEYDQRRRGPAHSYRSYHSDFDGRSYSLGATLGRPFAPRDDLILRPFASYESLHLRTDAFAESPDIYALRFAKTDSKLHRLRAGVDAAFSFTGDAYVSGRVFYSGLYGDRDGHTRASFVNDPHGNVFTPPVDLLDKHALGLSAGAGVRMTKNLEMTIDYSFLGGKHSKSHQGTLGLRLRF
jgi:outer membrane autotransporter protein